MLLHFPIPMYRFLDQEIYADSMVNNGLVPFNTISALSKLENPQYSDFDEGGHTFKIQTPMYNVGAGPWPR